DEPQLVGVAVRVVRIVALGGAREVDREVLVEEERRAPIEELPAGLEAIALIEAAADREAPLLFRRRRRIPAVRLGDLAMRGDRIAVIEIRERAAEAAAGVHLFVEEVPGGVAEDGVRLGRHEADRLTIDHGRLLVFYFVGTWAARCARSM